MSVSRPWISTTPAASRRLAWTLKVSVSINGIPLAKAAATLLLSMNVANWALKAPVSDSLRLRAFLSATWLRVTTAKAPRMLTMMRHLDCFMSTCELGVRSAVKQNMEQNMKPSESAAKAKSAVGTKLHHVRDKVLYEPV